MRRSLFVTAALLGAALSLPAAQDFPPGAEKRDRDGKESTPQVKGSPIEVRVYLWEKTKMTPVDIKDWTATLQVETKGGLKKTVPMTLTQPRPDDKMAVGHGGQMKDVEGTNWQCELVVLKAEKKDEPKRDGTTPKAGEPGDQDRNGAAPGDRPQDKGTEEGKKKHSHAGPYFKAELSAEEMPAAEFTASIVLTHKGETKTVTGFRYPFMKHGTEERKNGDPKPGDTPGTEKPGTPGTPGTPDSPPRRP